MVWLAWLILPHGVPLVWAEALLMEAWLLQRLPWWHLLLHYLAQVAGELRVAAF